MQAEAAVRRIRPEHIGMPNIVAGRRIVPEYIQNEATPARLAEEVLALLSHPDERARVKRDLAEVRAALGEPGASARTARMVLALAEGEDQHQVK
jgi:lipid-A-disaccharide synthase